MRLEAILFDHDGTLVDSEATHWLLWRRLLAKYDRDLSEQDYKAYCAGVPTPLHAELVVQRLALPASARELAEKKDLLLQEFLAGSSFPLMPYAHETLTFFKHNGMKLGVVTGAGRLAVDNTLKRYGLASLFDIVVSGDDVVRSKPAPDVYLHALKLLAVPPQRGLAVEDTSNGVRAAVAAGLTCLAVRNDFSRHHDFAGAAHVFDHLEELRAWVAAEYL